MTREMDFPEGEIKYTYIPFSSLVLEQHVFFFFYKKNVSP